MVNLGDWIVMDERGTQAASKIQVVCMNKRIPKLHKLFVSGSILINIESKCAFVWSVE